MNAAHTSGSFDWRRRNMVQRLAKMGISRADVLAAMGNVPRHVFVEEALRSRAYDDMSLPSVLEIGTGCGYQTAVLQAVGLKQIYSVERLQALHEKAKHNLRTARLLGGTRLVCGDGYLGLPEVAPFNGILVTAAPAEVPLPLLQQLAVGGRMVIPLDEGGQQYLWLIEKTAHGFHETCVHEARFVPLINGT